MAADTVRRALNWAAWWLLANVGCILGWLYVASRIWPQPPYEHCDFAPGDPWWFFFLVVPLWFIAMAIQGVALIFALQNRRTSRWFLLFVALLGITAWIGAAAYDHHRGQRYVTEQC